jgi:hypothetical protein
MSTSPAEIAAENGRPPKGERAPVIRRVVINDEDTASRVLNRYVPAWIISGGIHVVVIGAMVLFWKMDATKGSDADDAKIVATKIEEKDAPQENFQNEALGLDAELASATNSPREEMEVIEGPTVADEPIGAPNEQMEQPTQTFAPPGLGPSDLLKGSNADLSDKGMGLQGEMGGGKFTAPGMKGRSGATKERLLREGGGNTETEAAVARALAWLAKQQKTDGRWSFGDGLKGDEVAATGLALLPFLAAGYTHKAPPAFEKDKKDRKEYTALVTKGLAWLSAKQMANGSFVQKDVTTNYSQGIVTMVFCEVYAMTKDPNIKDRAQKGLNYIVAVQEKEGGWGYQPKQTASQDTSIVGWQIQALRSGQIAELNVPDAAVTKANDWLIGVSSEKESKYGYGSKQNPTVTLSAVGLLCRQYIKNWGPNNPSLALGVEYLKTAPPDMSRWDLYYYYYATQVMHFFEGKVWFEFWNPAMRKVLLDRQVKGGANGGSWDADNQLFGKSTGRLGATCLACLTLEVYYRHLPAYKRGTQASLD